MKYVRIGLLVLGLLALLCSPALAGRLVSRVAVSDASPRAGDTVSASVMLDTKGANLGSYTAELDWDADVLAYVEASGQPAGFLGVVNDTQAGHLRFNGASAQGASGEITLLVVTFEVVGRGRSPLDLEYAAMAEAGTFANLLPVRVRDGAVRVK